jgi:hypothetical protein
LTDINTGVPTFLDHSSVHPFNIALAFCSTFYETFFYFPANHQHFRLQPSVRMVFPLFSQPLAAFGLTISQNKIFLPAIYKSMLHLPAAVGIW